MTHPLLPIPVLPHLTAVHQRGGFLSARAEPLKASAVRRAVAVEVLEGPPSGRFP